MGAVYKAEHLLMKRVVALKVTSRAVAGSAATVERFRREYRASALLSHPNPVGLYEVASGKEAGGFDTGLDGPIALLSPDGRLLLTFGIKAQKHVVRVWKLATSQEVSSFQLPAQPFLCLAFSPNGRRILSGSGFSLPATNPPLILWDLATGEEVGRLDGPEDGVFSVAFSPDGRSALATAGDGTVRLYRLPDPPAK
jgi:WD40 repeat protein